VAPAGGTMFTPLPAEYPPVPTVVVAIAIAIPLLCSRGCRTKAADTAMACAKDMFAEECVTLDLPPPDTRWWPSRKGAVVLAARRGINQPRGGVPALGDFARGIRCLGRGIRPPWRPQPAQHPIAELRPCRAAMRPAQRGLRPTASGTSCLRAGGPIGSGRPSRNAPAGPALAGCRHACRESAARTGSR
jgi:hypothetical protein